MPDQDHHARIRKLRAEGLKCEVQGCFKLRQKLGRFCEHHDRVNQRTGHPEGEGVTKFDLKPYHEAALVYIDRHTYVPDIEAGLTWIDRVMGAGKRHPRPWTPLERVSDWFARMREAEVPPQDVLAVIGGMYLMAEVSGFRPGFKDQRHFMHQLAIRVLRLVPAPRFKARNGSGREYWRYAPITVGMREFLGPRLVKALGAVGLRIAREMVKEHEEQLRRDFEATISTTPNSSQGD
jgi:hypothetical protein